PASTVATSSPGLSTMGAGRIPHSDLDAAPRRKWKQPCALPLMSNGHLTTKPSEHRAPPIVSPSGRHAAYRGASMGTGRYSTHTQREEPRWLGITYRCSLRLTPRMQSQRPLRQNALPPM